MKKIYEIIPVTFFCLIYFFGFVEWPEFTLFQGIRALLLYSGSVLVAMHVRRNDLSKGALIMGLGIISLGPLYNMHLVNEVSIVPFLLGGLWLQISVHYVVGARNVFSLSETDPNQIFLIGTWVAATSVLGVNILFYYPEVIWISRVAATAAFIIWVYYIILAVNQMVSFRWKGDKVRVLHGGILLTTVSTQSVVIICDWAWALPILIEAIVLYVGVIFYLVSVSLLLIRYGKFKWRMTDDWKNTNCIIHGALSITGVAWFNLTGTVSPVLIAYWWVVFLLFVLVEFVEVYRAFKRVKHFGVHRGLWVYHPSQWARIFTFGMFYYLTLTISIPPGPSEYLMQKGVFILLGPVILVMTFLQLVVMFTQSFVGKPINKKRSLRSL